MVQFRQVFLQDLDFLDFLLDHTVPFRLSFRVNLLILEVQEILAAQMALQDLYLQDFQEHPVRLVFRVDRFLLFQLVHLVVLEDLMVLEYRDHLVYLEALLDLLGHRNLFLPFLLANPVGRVILAFP